MSTLQKNVRLWLKGLVAALVGGGAGGVTSGFTAIGVDPDHFNLAGGLGHTLKLMFACFVVNGLMSTFLYLKQSPVPQDEPESK